MDLQCQLDMPMIKSKVFDNHSDDRMDEFCKKSIENVKEMLNFKQKKKAMTVEESESYFDSKVVYIYNKSLIFMLEI